MADVQDNQARLAFRLRSVLTDLLNQRWTRVNNVHSTLVECPVCSAVVHLNQVGSHAEWHEALAERLG